MTPKTGRRWLWPLVVLVGSVLAFASLAGEVARHEPIFFDATRVPAGASPHLLGPVMTFFTLAGGGVGVLLLAAIVLAVLLARRRFHAAAFFVVAFEGARLLGRVLKDTFDRPRPDAVARAADVLPTGYELALVALVGVVVVLGLPPGRRRLALLLGGMFLLAVAVDLVAKRTVTVEAGYDSFPSGHAISSMSLVVALALLAWPDRWRWAAVIAGATFVVGVGASRVYFGLHHPSDVLAGWLMALGWTVGVWLLVRARVLASLRAPGTAMAAGQDAAGDMLDR